jgi:hypothetical protein
MKWASLKFKPMLVWYRGFQKVCRIKIDWLSLNKKMGTYFNSLFVSIDATIALVHTIVG